MKDPKDIPYNEKVSNTPLRTEDLERDDDVSHTSDRDQNKKRMSVIQAFFDKLKPVRGVAMTQEEYAAYKGRDVSGPDEQVPDDLELDQPGPDMTEGMSNSRSVNNSVEEFEKARVRQSMDEYEEEWVERFVQSKNVGERQYLMDELQERKILHEHEEAYVEAFVNERDPDKREVLVNNIREKHSAYEEYVRRSAYSPQSAHLSSSDNVDLNTHQEAFVEDFVNERDPDKREMLVNNLQEKQSAYNESESRSAYSPEAAQRFAYDESVSQSAYDEGAVQLSSDDIADLNTHEEAFVEDFVNERDPDKREVLVNNLREKQSAYNESVSRPVHDANSLKLSAVRLSSDDIADLSTAEPSRQL